MSHSSALDPGVIRDNLKTLRIGTEIVVHEEVGSTNEIAKASLERGDPEGLVVIANRQSRGKGRSGRTWSSVADVGIYLSIALIPEMKSVHLPRLTLMAGVAAVDAVNGFARSRATLKWPNDILVDNKKLGGILCERCRTPNAKDAVVIGIGLNVNHDAETFAEEIRSLATSLKIANGQAVDRLALIRSLIHHLDSEYEALLLSGEQPLIRKWTRNTKMFGKPVALTRGSAVTRGTALRLDDWGNLVIRTEDGNEVSFDSGEVTLGHE